ncbi:hypothetical protein U1Q18_023917 [Sarracenia purpurea var. burkii]
MCGPDWFGVMHECVGNNFLVTRGRRKRDVQKERLGEVLQTGKTRTVELGFSRYSMDSLFQAILFYVSGNPNFFFFKCTHPKSFIELSKNSSCNVLSTHEVCFDPVSLEVVLILFC